MSEQDIYRIDGYARAPAREKYAFITLEAGKGHKVSARISSRRRGRERESEKCSALVKSYIFRFAALLISSGTGRYGTRGILFDFIIRALSALPLCFFLASIYYDGSQPLRRVSEDTLFLFEVHLMHVNQSYTKTIILITIIDIFFNEYSFFIFT